MGKIEFRIPDKKKDKLKDYCVVHNITISKLFINYVDTLVEKPNKVPVKEKNSGKNATLTKLFHCPWCGTDITELVPADRLNHLQNCKNGQKE